MSIIAAGHATTNFFREMWREEGKVAAIGFGILCTGVALGALIVIVAFGALALGALGVIPMHGGGSVPVNHPVHVPVRVPIPRVPIIVG
jgi:hypothetical protein